jgi:hypothetical protein
VVAVAWAIGATAAGRRTARRWEPGLAVFVVPTLIYLWRARAFPDHLWVMRRFLPVTLPGLVLGALAVAQHLAHSGRPGVSRLASRGTAAVVAVAAVAGPAATLVPVPGLRTQSGMLSAVMRLCDAAGDDAAVLVLSDGSLAQTLPQTVRSFCDTPAAGARPELTGADVARLSAAAEEDGSTLVLVGPDVDSVAALAGAAPAEVVDIVATNPDELEQTLSRRPKRYVEATWRFAVARVDPP